MRRASMAVIVLVAAAFAVGVFVLDAQPAAQPAATAQCSRAVADELLKQQHLGPTWVEPHPAGDVLCGSFTGPGSNAMAVTFRLGICMPALGWAVFRFAAGRWQRVLVQNAVYAKLTAEDGDIRETAPIYRPGDKRCFPSGGTKTRVWHWSGVQLTATPWNFSRTPTTYLALISPSGNLQCEMSDDGGGDAHVRCQSFKSPHAVKLAPDGRLNRCTGQLMCIGNLGETRTTRFAYGMTKTVGRFRCHSEMSGITCTVVASGRGFFIDRNTVKPIP
jgi:hypothetical protein